MSEQVQSSANDTSEAGTVLFFVAVFPTGAQDEGTVVYAESPSVAPEIDAGAALEECFRDEEGGYVVGIPKALHDGFVLVFDGWAKSAEQHHADECGCDDAGGEDCEEVLPDWAYVAGGTWRRPTVADLTRAGVVADGAE